jgi:regulator of replication initiation timing
MRLFKSALDNLKSEQVAIKETVVALRRENARLRDGDDEPVSPTPRRPSLPPPARPDRSPGAPSRSPSLPPPSARSPKKVTHEPSSDLDSRLKAVERENARLKEANASLSAKLCEEMEKTEALRTANDGLAARICKLVAFIKENPSTSAPAKNSSLS